MKDVTMFDSEAAGSEINRIKRNARGLETLIKFIRNYLPDYEPSFKALEEIFRDRDVSGKIARIIASESSTKLTFSEPAEKDQYELGMKLLDELRPLTVNIKPSKKPTWEYWYGYKYGKVEIRQGYTGEIKQRHNHQLKGDHFKAFKQAEAIVEMLNKSPELVSKGTVNIPGVISRFNGVKNVFEIESDYFLRLARG